MIEISGQNQKVVLRLLELAKGRGLDAIEFGDNVRNDRGNGERVYLYVTDVATTYDQSSELVTFLKENSFRKAIVVNLSGEIFERISYLNGAIQVLNVPLQNEPSCMKSSFYLSYALELLGGRDFNLPCVDQRSQNIVRLIQKISNSDVTVLVNGPTGSGKEVVSKLIHNVSCRAAEPFVAVNCAAIPEQMLESTLFGHEKGSFTGAVQANVGLIRAANNGTILLDEISEMPLALQAKLLRVLQEKKVMPVGSTSEVDVNVRIVATTNRDMPSEVKQGNFREDLYYRLNVFPLATLALAERSKDIAAIVAHMLLKLEGDVPQHTDITASALEELSNYTWPGNVRELYNVVQRAKLICSDNVISASDLVFDSPEFGLALNTADVLAAKFNVGIEEETLS
jgi:two-component system response regulator FlrC